MLIKTNQKIEEKFEYLPEVYIGEDYSDLDDQIFIDENGEDYETDNKCAFGVGTDIVQI